MSISSEAARPPEPPGPLIWVRRNLFNSWLNGLLTIIIAVVIIFTLRGLLNWIVNVADWRPVINFPFLYLVGQYPRDQLWRIGLSTSLVALLFGLSWGTWGGLIRTFAVSLGGFFAVVALLPVQSNVLTIAVRGAILANVLLIFLGFRLGRLQGVKSSYTAIAWLLAIEVITLILLPGLNLRETLTLLIGSVLVFIIIFIIYQATREGGISSTLRVLFLIAVILGAVEIAFASIPNLANTPLIQKVATTSWGGLLVTFFLAAGGIVLSFPIGVVLALGRRSSLPVVKVFCTTFIEVVRGVPLVTILFMFSVILQLFLPPEARIDRLLRALMGMTFFSAAYTAENVRGGLQAVPQGQVEAAKSVGLNGFQTMTLIVLPQALRAVIPAIVGQFISLFKDTTLVIIVGINELLGIGKSIINSDPEFIQLQAEVFIFIAMVFWISSYILSYASRQLETALGVGER